MDKIIHKNIDVMDTLEEAVQKDIDEMIADIDIDMIVSGKIDAVMGQFAKEFKALIMEKYSHKAIEAGVSFSKDIKKRKADIQVDKSKDNELNAGLFKKEENAD